MTSSPGTERPFPPFAPRFPWLGPDLQTVRNVLRGPSATVPDGERLRFPMSDGSGDVLLGALNRPATDQGRPTAILVHGLTGCESGTYMLASAAALLRAGYPVVRLNLRGAGPSRALCRLRYHAGRSQDLRDVLAALPDDLAGRGVVMVGYSLGGNALLKMLGEGATPVPVLAAASVSAPIDLARTSRTFMAPRNVLYHRWLLDRMKLETVGDGAVIDARWVEAARTVRSVYEFDDRIIGPWNGWSGADEYYAVNSALGFLPRITVPTLVVHALDDPWIPGDIYKGVDWAANPNLTPLLSPGGGHVGFHGRGGPWHDACITAFFGRATD